MKDKDYLNYRYLCKRALFLDFIRRHLQRNGGDRFGRVCVQEWKGDSVKPILCLHYDRKFRLQDSFRSQTVERNAEDGEEGETSDGIGGEEEMINLVGRKQQQQTKKQKKAVKVHSKYVFLCLF